VDPVKIASALRPYKLLGSIEEIDGAPWL